MFINNAKLEILQGDAVPPYYRRIKVTGRAVPSQGDFDGNLSYKLQCSLYGDDYYFDNKVFTMSDVINTNSENLVNSTGILLTWQDDIYKEILDEDWHDGDEIYGKINYVVSPLQTRGSVKTNVVHGNW